MLASLKFIILNLCIAATMHPYLLGAESAKDIQVPRLAEGAKIDGILNEKEWDSAAVASDFTQVEPISMGEPSQRTELRVFSTSKALYIGLRCYDSEPD